MFCSVVFRAPCSLFLVPCSVFHVQSSVSSYSTFHFPCSVSSCSVFCVPCPMFHVLCCRVPCSMVHVLRLLVPCSVFCASHWSDECRTELTKTVNDNDEQDDPADRMNATGELIRHLTIRRLSILYILLLSESY